MIKQISPAQAAQALSEGVRLIDVRNPFEWDIVHIEGSELLNQAMLEQLIQLPKDTPLMFLCHHGSRSLQASAYFSGSGFTDISNVQGGIEAWADIDPSLARY